jgi:WD40 repeat protein
VTLFSLTVGNDEGIVQIWSLEESSISLLLSLKINSTISLGSGKIRSISWHASSRWLGVAGLQLGFVIFQYSEPHSWTRVVAAMEPPDFALPTNSYLHYMDWSPMALAFVVDRTVYELVPSSSMSSNSSTSRINNSNNNHSNVFRENPVANPTVVYRAVAVLEACRLCTLSQWSHDGQFIATAFGSEIIISQLRPDTSHVTASLDHWELVQNITTVQDTYMIITAMEWSPNGQYLAVGGTGNDRLFLYDTMSWQAVQIPTAYGIHSLAWRPDSQQIAIGTGRMIEIHEFRSHPHDDSYPSITLVPLSYPTYSPSDYSMYVSPSSPPTIPSSDGIMSMARMAGIGIAAVVLSLSCVALVFLQRWKFLQRRRRRSQDDDSKMGAHAEPTMSEDDYDSPMDRVITFTRNPNSSDNVVVE